MSPVAPAARHAPAAPHRPRRAVPFLACTILVIAPLAGAAPLTAAADPDWHIPGPAGAVTTAGDDANNQGEPTQHDFVLMKDALARYRAIEEAGGWAAIPPGPPLQVGMRDPRVELLRNRLRAGGDYDGEMGADPWFFDWALDQAVRRLQRRNLLPENGIFDDDALAAANVTVGERIGQLSVAMERWRWLPRELGRRFVWVNIPRAQLDVVEDGRSTLSMRVVVGHRDRPTPSLSGEIDRVVFNPTWAVPAAIAAEDLVPRQQADAGFLARNRIRVFRGSGAAAQEIDPAAVDWSRLGPGRLPYRLVQDAGPGNSLGRIKLGFPNPFDIYLHDTPAKGMFGLTTRWLSSGCVRLEDAPALATLLMAGDRQWDDGDTQTAVAAGRTRTINLGACAADLPRLHHGVVGRRRRAALRPRHLRQRHGRAGGAGPLARHADPAAEVQPARIFLESADGGFDQESAHVEEDRHDRLFGQHGCLGLAQHEEPLRRIRRRIRLRKHGVKLRVRVTRVVRRVAGLHDSQEAVGIVVRRVPGIDDRLVVAGARVLVDGDQVAVERVCPDAERLPHRGHGDGEPAILLERGIDEVERERLVGPVARLLQQLPRLRESLGGRELRVVRERCLVPCHGRRRQNVRRRRPGRHDLLHDAFAIDPEESARRTRGSLNGGPRLFRRM